MAKVYSYAVARDFGFAPNPFYGICTLATCKPKIRAKAIPGDLIIGTGSKELKYAGRLIYAMQVSETLSFDQYWSDPRFIPKKPELSASLKKRFGDNIYHSTPHGWAQLDSHHSLKDGSPNPRNIEVDTSADRVLISNNFSYFGRSAPPIPKGFRNFNGVDVCHRRGHKCKFEPDLVAALFDYFRSLERGYLGEPISWT